MMTRSQLLQQWQHKLSENQLASSSGSLHLSWLRRTYVRVYQFLISSYRRGDWRASRKLVTDEQQACAESSVVDFTSDLAGKPAKTDAQIRRALKSFQAAKTGGDPSGPLRKGLSAWDWIAVASLSSRTSPKDCVQLLKQNEMEARAVRRGDDVIVEVRLPDREKALSLIRESRSALRISIPLFRYKYPVIHGALQIYAHLLVASMVLLVITKSAYLMETVNGKALLLVVIVFWIAATLFLSSFQMKHTRRLRD